MTFVTALLIVFGLIVTIQITYYVTFLSAFLSHKPIQQKKKKIALSAIVCAKNEAKTLKENIPFLLEQDHPNFELVLVNDSSTDETLEVMTGFENRYNNVKVVDVKSNEAFWGNKKYALTLGIKASKNDFLIFTDADCKPNTNQWLNHISSRFSNQKAIVLGYGGYAKKKGSLLNQIIRYETIFTALQYFSYAIIGQTYMGVGRNLAYRKELFFNNSGFSKHMSLMSGDDDLFINSVATRHNTAISLDGGSFTTSIPKTTFKDWLLQKRRHISTSKFYKPRHKLLLGLFYTSQLLFWILMPIILFLPEYIVFVLCLIGLRFIFQIAAMTYAAKIFKELDLLLIAPLLELFLVLFQLVIFISNLISKPAHWK